MSLTENRARYVVQDRKSQRWVCGHQDRDGADHAARQLALHRPQNAHWVWDLDDVRGSSAGRVVYVADPEVLTMGKPRRKKNDGKG